MELNCRVGEPGDLSALCGMICGWLVMMAARRSGEL